MGQRLLLNTARGLPPFSLALLRSRSHQRRSGKGSVQGALALARTRRVLGYLLYQCSPAHGLEVLLVRFEVVGELAVRDRALRSHDHLPQLHVLCLDSLLLLLASIIIQALFAIDAAEGALAPRIGHLELAGRALLPWPEVDVLHPLDDLVVLLLQVSLLLVLALLLLASPLGLKLLLPLGFLSVEVQHRLSLLQLTQMQDLLSTVVKKCGPRYDQKSQIRAAKAPK